MKPEELIKQFPRLFHMAEDGSWPSIREHGLLSTSSLLDLYSVSGVERRLLENAHRPESVVIVRPGKANATVRDQKPMSDQGLQRSLRDGLTPTDWYGLLNSMCFFWLTEERLLRLLNARPYRNVTHTVLVLDTNSVVEMYRDLVRLSPINSGCTKPFPHPRGRDTFLGIEEYPFDYWVKKRNRNGAVVEFCVKDGVRDVETHVLQVRRMRGSEMIEEL